MYLRTHKDLSTLSAGAVIMQRWRETHYTPDHGATNHLLVQLLRVERKEFEQPMLRVIAIGPRVLEHALATHFSAVSNALREASEIFLLNSHERKYWETMIAVAPFAVVRDTLFDLALATDEVGRDTRTGTTVTNLSREPL